MSAFVTLCIDGRVTALGILPRSQTKRPFRRAHPKLRTTGSALIFSITLGVGGSILNIRFATPGAGAAALSQVFRELSDGSGSSNAAMSSL